MPDGGGDNGEEATPSSPLTFHSENIGQWSSKQEGLFDEQNRRAAEQIKLRQARLRRLRPFILAGSGLLVVLVIIASIMLAFVPDQLPPLPGNITLGSAGAQEVSETAQGIFDDFFKKHDSGSSSSATNPAPEENQAALDAVADYFDRQIERTDNVSTKIDLTLIEMQFYAYKGSPESVLKASQDSDINNMTETQAQQFLGMLIDAAFGTGNTELGEYYVELEDKLFPYEVENEEG